MSIDEILEAKIREIVREELLALAPDGARRLEPWELAQRWNTQTDVISRLVRAGNLKAIRLSERKMVFAMEEILRFEQGGGIAELEIAA